MAVRHASFAEFWPHYLREHAHPLTRRLHAAGTGLGLLLLLAGLILGPWWLVLLGVVAGYGFAWLSHLLVERNRPATFSHPLWSLLADLRMAWLMLTGALEAELLKAGVTGPGVTPGR
ncbi:MAG: DUF962 domain-containing protein [Roseococcus sp.]|nr:DUF962 domain-containing protein [Roseococcus sp.]